MNATFTGMHDHDHRLPDWSPEGIEAALSEMQALRTSLVVEQAATTALTDVAARDVALAISFLEIQIAELEGTHFQRSNPSLAVGEAVFGVIALMTRAFAPVSVRADAAVERLRAIPAFLDGARRSIPDDAAPVAWRAKTLRECEGADRLFGGGIERWIEIEGIDATRGDRLASTARAARAAVDDWRRWLSQASSAGHDGACGGDLFDVLLARGHWCERTRRDLALDARDQLDTALARLDERAAAAAPGGWPEIQERLAKRHPRADDYLPSYERIWNACHARATALDLVTWPDYPIRFTPIPPHTREAAPYLYYLHYRAPAPFDPIAVYDYAVTPIDPDMPNDEQTRRLRATNTSVITLNHVVHHGGIGHHIQNYRAYHGPSEIGRVAAVDCACRIGMFLGGTMAEGWACYATDLMDSVGFLTPEESIAQQHTRARLLARAVVDIGLHERSLTVDEAVSLYRDRIGTGDEAARAEVCKNSMYPGAAVMYWLGTEGIHALRRDVERTAGAAFSLREFHDRLLGFGSIPVPLIARVWQP